MRDTKKYRIEVNAEDLRRAKKLTGKSTRLTLIKVLEDYIAYMASLTDEERKSVVRMADSAVSGSN